ncbi:MAG: CcmD family protein [Flavobacteriales bacterium]
MKPLFFLILALLYSYDSFAGGIESSMHAAGKMNVTLGVIAIIFIGIVVYLFLVDRKITRLEKEIKERQS